jgi:hypothetical protein
VSWGEVMKCLQGHGKTTIERALPAARLVRVVQNEGESSFDHAFYLYVLRDGRVWEFASAVPAQHVTVLGFVPQTIARHQGYRLSIGELYRTEASLDGTTSIPVTVAEQHSVFCSGNTDDCATAITHCDVIYRGKPLWTFRGTLAFGKGVIIDAGDRSHGGSECSPTEVVPLVWPTN